MELSELAAYAAERYHIREYHKWADFPGFSVLADPADGRWLALLMRQWDSESGVEIQRCDIRCGRDYLRDLAAPCLSTPFRMKGAQWLGVTIDANTEAALVFHLFDQAVAQNAGAGCTLVLENAPTTQRLLDAEAPRSVASFAVAGPNVPERIRTMLSLGDHPAANFKQKCKTFYLQGKFMEDYEDDQPYHGEFRHYFPTYRDLTLSQLRGYFTWRTRLRRGGIQPIATSLAYIYLYELLNGIGATSPANTLARMQAFEEAFIDSGIGDVRMRDNLHRWMFEFAVLHDFPPETARRFCAPALLGIDAALALLRAPETATDDALFDALARFAGKPLANSPLLQKAPAESKRLFAAAWCAGAADGLFDACFGEPRCLTWHPLANAIYWQPHTHADADYVLDPCRSYHCREGVWTEVSYQKQTFDSARFTAFLHETERLLRKHLKIGRPFREKPEEAWVRPYVEAAIAAEREAARAQVAIDLSHLAQIRDDAAITRERLLTEAELELPVEETAPAPSAPVPPAEAPLIPGLDAAHSQLLSALLRGEDITGTLSALHLLPSIVTDTINAGLFDEIGDNVLDCDGRTITLVDDYKEDLINLIGGMNP